MEANENGPKLILASKSPRRRYLLKQAGLEFAVVHSRIREDTLPVLAPEIYAKTLAHAKAREVAERYPDSWVIGADTVVVIDGLILGKPRSPDEAHTMLNRLSGKTHQVFTGVSICRKSTVRLYSESFRTDVTFKVLTGAEIDWYIHTGEPFDKAGAYAIQGIGTFLVKRINGSYTNVVGLPVCEVIEFLLKEGIVGLGAHRADSIAHRV